jgi:DNA-binding response OmpR family regulator
MSGIELAGRLRGGGTRVLYLTGTVARDELDGPYLSKPFTPAQLRDAVAAQLSRHD